MGIKFFLQWIILGLIGSILLTVRDKPKNKAVALKTMYFLLWIATLLIVIVSVILAPGDRLAVGALYSILYWMVLCVIKRIVIKGLKQ